MIPASTNLKSKIRRAIWIQLATMLVTCGTLSGLFFQSYEMLINTSCRIHVDSLYRYISNGELRDAIGAARHFVIENESVNRIEVLHSGEMILEVGSLEYPSLFLHQESFSNFGYTFIYIYDRVTLMVSIFLIFTICSILSGLLGIWWSRRIRRQHEIVISQEKSTAVAKATTTIVHDLKGPLATIEHFLSSDEGDKEEIRCAHGRLLAMVDSIKNSDLDQIVRPVLAKFDCNEWKRNLRSITAVRGAEIELQGPDLNSLVCDWGKLTRAIENMVINSVEAGARQVKIVWESDNRDFIIRVIDDGSGISDQVMLDINLNRGPVKSTKAQGTGIGLTFVAYSDRWRHLIPSDAGTLFR